VDHIGLVEQQQEVRQTVAAVYFECGGWSGCGGGGGGRRRADYLGHVDLGGVDVHVDLESEAVRPKL